MKKTASNIFKVLGYILLVMGQYLLGGIIYIALILLLIPDLGPKWLVIVIAIIFYVVWFYILRGLAYLLLWLSKFLNKEVLNQGNYLMEIKETMKDNCSEADKIDE